MFLIWRRSVGYPCPSRAAAPSSSLRKPLATDILERGQGDAQGGELKLLNLTKKVHDLLQITKLYTVFDVKDDEATAVKAFSK